MVDWIPPFSTSSSSSSPFSLFSVFSDLRKSDFFICRMKKISSSIHGNITQRYHFAKLILIMYPPPLFFLPRGNTCFFSNFFFFEIKSFPTLFEALILLYSFSILPPNLKIWTQIAP
ncbi:hypothetical protein Droror1_Dr00021337 [Drosera rotundifolia]